MKRFFVASLSLFLLLSATPGLLLSVHAQTPTPGPWYNQNPTQFHGAVFGTAAHPVPDNEIFGERYTYAQINWILNSLANIFSIPVADIPQLGNYLRQLMMRPSPPTMQDYAQFGLPGLLSGSMAEAYLHPPASGIDTINSTLARFNIAPPVQAQGYGFNSLSAIQLLWTASRNSAYLLMVILLIAAGFLIMFRVKINPQTVVSLQLMIPKIILTLVLVTFSYAIAGLVIDLVYVTIALAVIALQTGHVFTNPVINVLTYFTNSNFNSLALFYALPGLLIFFGGALAAGVGILSIITGPVGIAMAVLGSLAAIIALVFSVIIIWIIFKVWWMLLKTYVTLLLLIIIGPWQIMLGILPGQSGFGSWFRNLIANASVFAVVPLMFLFSMILWPLSSNRLLGQWGATAQTVLGWLIPYIAPLGTINFSGSGALPNLPLVQGTGAFFQFALGYVILALTPKAAEIVRDTLKAPTFKYGNAIGQPIGFVTNPILESGIATATARARAAGVSVEEASRMNAIASLLNSLKMKS